MKQKRKYKKFANFAKGLLLSSALLGGGAAKHSR